jgi:class 3 adenylate cyclase
MAEQRVERRLAAILAADVVGFSRLMEADEVGTLNALKAHRRALGDPAIASHHGRIVKTTGDGMLVEFGSIVDAVACAVAIQRGMIGRNAEIAEDKRIVFRIGINVGDIIIDGDDIFGDGVNVAARLQTLCEPGGLCISRAANEQIRDTSSLWRLPILASRRSRISRAPSGCSACRPRTLRVFPIREWRALPKPSRPPRRWPSRKMKNR